MSKQQSGFSTILRTCIECKHFGITDPEYGHGECLKLKNTIPPEGLTVDYFTYSDSIACDRFCRPGWVTIEI